MVWPFKKQANEQEQAYQLNSKLDQDSGMQNPGTQDPVENSWLGDKPQRDDFTKWTQQLGDEVQKFTATLMSGFYDENKNFIHKKDTKGNDLPPLVNNLGVCRIIGFMEPLTSKNLMNSNYSTEDINIALRTVYLDLIEALATHQKEWDIEKKDLSFVFCMFQSVVKPTFLRALNDGERRHIRTFSKHISTTGERLEPKKKKMFGIGDGK